MVNSNNNNSLLQDTEKAMYLPSSYTGEAKIPKLEETGQIHVKKILDSEAISVLDLGCGAGGILLELQKKGVKFIHGIDASPEGIELAKKRCEKFGTLENTIFTVGNIINFDPPIVDAVSSHAVLHCFPDAVGIVKKAMEKRPQLVVITFANDKISTKIMLRFVNSMFWVYGLFSKFIKGRKIYIHSRDKIHTYFEENGYELTFSQINGVTQTFVYELLARNLSE